MEDSPGKTAIKQKQQCFDAVGWAAVRACVRVCVNRSSSSSSSSNG